MLPPTHLKANERGRVVERIHCTDELQLQLVMEGVRVLLAGEENPRPVFARKEGLAQVSRKVRRQECARAGIEEHSAALDRWRRRRSRCGGRTREDGAHDYGGSGAQHTGAIHHELTHANRERPADGPACVATRKGCPRTQLPPAAPSLESAPCDLADLKMLLLPTVLAVAAYAPSPCAQQLMHVSSTPRRSVLLATAADTTASDYILQKLDAAKGSFLLHTWSMAAQTVRANGFTPASEAVGDGALRMKRLADELPGLVSAAKILGLCDRGSLSYDTLEEPHASMAERLSRTELRSALSVGRGSAVAFVSTWDDCVSIDACVVNPKFLVLGEGAEAALLRNVATSALEAATVTVPGIVAVTWNRLVTLTQARGLQCTRGGLPED